MRRTIKRLLPTEIFAKDGYERIAEAIVSLLKPQRRAYEVMSARREQSIDDSGTAIVCGHIAEAGYPDLRACRNEPVVDEDSGWQFTCGASGHTDETGQVWSLSEEISHDDLLVDVIGLPAGSSVVRTRLSSPWERGP
ncbi:MAG: hypothetical protein JNJ46_04195 [Myxococcales bacterium]|nr:hypothetical protein [Myxococcales bacterium]